MIGSSVGSRVSPIAVADTRETKKCPSTMEASGNRTLMMGSSCMHSMTPTWTQRHNYVGEFFAEDSVTAPEDEGIKTSSRPLRENNRKNRGCKHVPHKDKPAQVVAKRNARERKRVQAVNTAFSKLRRAVPIDNTRGKRVSKVKTLQYAINYIYNLQKLLEDDLHRHHSSMSSYCPRRMSEDFFEAFPYVQDF